MLEMNVGSKYWFLTDNGFIFGEIASIEEETISFEDAFYAQGKMEGYTLGKTTLYKNKIISFSIDRDSKTMSHKNTIPQ